MSWWWPFGERDSAGTAAEPAAPDERAATEPRPRIEAPTPGWNGWAAIPPLRPTIQRMPTLAALNTFESELATRSEPGFLQPLSHALSGDAPHGLVHAVPLPAGPRAAPGGSPGAHVQRRVTPPGTPLHAPGWVPFDTPDGEPIGSTPEAPEADTVPVAVDVPPLRVLPVATQLVTAPATAMSTTPLQRLDSAQSAVVPVARPETVQREAIDLRDPPAAADVSHDEQADAPLLAALPRPGIEEVPPRAVPTASERRGGLGPPIQRTSVAGTEIPETAPSASFDSTLASQETSPVQRSLGTDTPPLRHAQPRSAAEAPVSASSPVEPDGPTAEASIEHRPSPDQLAAVPEPPDTTSEPPAMDSAHPDGGAAAPDDVPSGPTSIGDALLLGDRLDRPGHSPVASAPAESAPEPDLVIARLPIETEEASNPLPPPEFHEAGVAASGTPDASSDPPRFDEATGASSPLVQGGASTQSHAEDGSESEFAPTEHAALTSTIPLLGARAINPAVTPAPTPPSIDTVSRGADGPVAFSVQRAVLGGLAPAASSPARSPGVAFRWLTDASVPQPGQVHSGVDRTPLAPFSATPTVQRTTRSSDGGDSNGESVFVHDDWPKSGEAGWTSPPTALSASMTTTAASVSPSTIAIGQPPLSVAPPAVGLQRSTGSPGATPQLVTHQAARPAQPTDTSDPGAFAVSSGLGTSAEDGGIDFAPPSWADDDVLVQRSTTTVQSESTPSSAGGDAAPPAPGAGTSTGPKDLHKLAHDLYPHLRTRLRNDLRLDRERAGRITDRIR